MPNFIDKNRYDPRSWGAKCDACPLNGNGFAAPTGPAGAPMAFVGEGPGKMEIIRREVLVGPSGAKLNELLHKAGIRREAVWCTNVLLCRAEVPGLEGKRKYDMKLYAAWFRKQNAERKRNGWPEQESPFDCCRPRLLKELGGLEWAAQQRGSPNGLVVVPMGNFALEAVTKTTARGGNAPNVNGDGTPRPPMKPPKGILKYRGSVLPVEGELT